MWQEPKTNWTREDSWDWREYERWRLNIEHLGNLILVDLPYIKPAIDLGRECVQKDGQDPADYTDTALCYRGVPDETVYNALEESLYVLSKKSGLINGFTEKTWRGNDWQPTESDLNRWEKACLDIYKRIASIQGIAPRVNTYRLNGGTF